MLHLAKSDYLFFLLNMVAVKIEKGQKIRSVYWGKFNWVKFHCMNINEWMVNWLVCQVTALWKTQWKGSECSDFLSCLWTPRWLRFSFLFRVTPFDLLQPSEERDWPPPFPIKMEQRGWRENKRAAVCVYAGRFDTPTGVMSMLRVDKGTRTDAHRHRSSRRTLPATPSVASWRFTSQSHRPVSAPLPPPPDKPLVLRWDSDWAASHTRTERSADSLLSS